MSKKRTITKQNAETLLALHGLLYANSKKRRLSEEEQLVYNKINKDRKKLRNILKGKQAGEVHVDASEIHRRGGKSETIDSILYLKTHPNTREFEDIGTVSYDSARKVVKQYNINIKGKHRAYSE